MTADSLVLNKDGYFEVTAGQFKLLLTPDECSEYGVETGAEISDAALGELIWLSERNDAVLTAVKMLAARDLSRSELISKLAAKGFGEHAEYAADEMQRLGYLDDNRYAKLMLTKYADKGYNFLRAVFEMEKRGINRELCEEIWQSEGLGDVLPSADEYLARLAEKGDPSDIRWLRKASGAMQRAGYSEEEIDSAISNIETLSGGFEE